MMMKSYHLPSLLIIAVATLGSHGVYGFDQPPSDLVRNHIKNTITEEDIAVMQAEMAWGVQEMQRYKSFKGEWPVRSAITGSETKDEIEDRQNRAAAVQAQARASEDDDVQALFRGRSNKKNSKYANETAHHEYWNYLISMF